MDDKKRGVYFLANDRVLDLCVAFLNSFRAHNPNLSLCMVPFDESIQELEKLRKSYDFTIYENNKIFKICDEISMVFHNKVHGQYRKLAIWDGDFDEFIYIDVDSIVLQDIEPVFELLSDYDFITASCNYASNLKWVWKKSIYKSGLLSLEQIAYAASTGFISSKKSALTLKYADDTARNSHILKQHIVHCGLEQSFFNYLIVTSGKRYTGLQIPSSNGGLRAGSFNYWWAGRENPEIKHKQLNSGSAPFFLIHWAGLWQPKMLERIVFRIMKILHIKNKDEHPKMRFFMPYKRLWRHYRFMQN